MTALGSAAAELDALFAVQKPVVRPLSEQTGLLYGPSGAGKTTLVAGMPGSVVIDTERGWLNQSGRILQATDWDGILGAFDVVERAPKGSVKTLILDTSTRAYSYALAKILAENGWRDESESPYYSARTKAAAEFQMLLRRMQDLAAFHGVGSWLVAHEQSEEVVTPTKVFTRAVPQLPSTKSVPLREEVIGSMQMILRLHPATDKDGKTVHVLRSRGREDFVAKDRSTRLPDVLVIPQVGAWDALQEAYTKGA